MPHPDHLYLLMVASRRITDSAIYPRSRVFSPRSFAQDNGLKCFPQIVKRNYILEAFR